MGKLTIFTNAGNKLQKFCPSHKSAMITLSIEFERIEGFAYTTTDKTIYGGKVRCPECSNPMHMFGRKEFHCDKCGLIVDTVRL